MTETVLDLDEMLDAGDRDKRDLIADWVKQEAVEKNIAQIAKLLDEQLKLCAIRALDACDQFHGYREQTLKDKEAVKPVYSTRVRLRGNSLQCEWVSNIYQTETGAVFSKRMKKGTSLRYHERSFHKAGQEEFDHIVDVENAYEKVRDAAARLRKLRSALAEYERCVKTLYVDIDKVDLL